MPKAIEYNATIVGRRDWTPALSSFQIRPDEAFAGEPGQHFVPGQYAVLGLNNEAQPELGSVRRPMSIVSAPAEGDTLEFYIRYVNHPESNNPLTHLLWKVGVGDRIFLGAKLAGRFTLPHTVGDDDPRLKVTVAAGTGLAPFLCMVRDRGMNDPAARLDDWAILHGASYPADLGYREELQRWQEERGVHYLGSVSRPKEAPGWDGDAGRVEDYFRAERLQELEERLGLGDGGLNPARATIFICGLQGTIGQTIIRLVGRGFVPENRRLRKALEVPEEVPASLFFEQYDTTPVVDLKDEELMADLRGRLTSAIARSASA